MHAGYAPSYWPSLPPIAWPVAWAAPQMSSIDHKLNVPPGKHDRAECQGGMHGLHMYRCSVLQVQEGAAREHSVRVSRRYQSSVLFMTGCWITGGAR
jgi:hypothetical protein